jgi:heat shock protein HslJ
LRHIKNARWLVSLLFVASFALGCAGSTPTLTSAKSAGASLDVGALTRTWNLVSIQPVGEGEQAKPSGASYTVTFGDGRLSTRVDCNSCGGSYTLDGQTLVAGPLLACTRAACATMAFENMYTKLLAGESTVSLSDGGLVLTSPRGVLRFTRFL